MSLAPERLSIGIRRLFTSVGVDPYDEVEWERRDARITNWKDGAVAFEQTDVEFPTSWSVNASNIVSQKYFRGTIGRPGREHSLRQVVDRVADTIATWGDEGGYFADEAEAEAFRAELKYILVTQRAAFNSPVWFNIGVEGVPQQASACFILSVDDTMDSILNWYREEGVIFKGGSGAGVNLSKIRSSSELLEGGGTASGPVSFMRGADASAGTIKSGGKTRRAAKMVILDVDHPDIEEFVWCKAKEERKARVLRDAGFEMDLDGADSHSIQYQNANNSVRVTDEFMQAVLEDADWGLVGVTTGEVVRTVRARELWHQVAAAAWDCADPGLQFDTTINNWHTAHTTGRINASNPCFTGDTLVHTDKGLVRFSELFARANAGEELGVYTHDITHPDDPVQSVQVSTPDAFMITGRNPIVRLRFDTGMELRCTPNHRIFTTNRGYVEASGLTADDHVRSLDLPTPAVNADWAIPVSCDTDDYHAKGDHGDELHLPEEWSDELAHYLGWLIGDGTTSTPSTTTVYGSAEDRDEVLPAHQRLVETINGGRPLKISEQASGTAQLRISRRVFKRYLEALGVASVTDEHKAVPWSIEQAPAPVVAAFLRGLFDADGCMVVDRIGGSYVGLGSISPELLRGVQRLLSTCGISSRIYQTDRAAASSFTSQRADGRTAEYQRRASYDLRISGRSMERFAGEIGFGLARKQAALQLAVVDRMRPYANVDTTIRLVERSDDGVELTYNLSEPRNHSYVANGVVVRNCSEYVHLDDSACNLASINLLKYLDADGVFAIDAFRHTVEVMFTAQEILVGRADYPTPSIADTSHRFRQLGLGYANLGALLMALGLPYDSPQGRAWAGALTSLMTGHAYATSARTASRMGAFAGYADNEAHMLRVLRMHRDAAHQIDDEEAVPHELLQASQQAWDDAVRDGSEFGVRNSQASVLAPTGCLVGGSLIATDRGLVRLGSLGDPDGTKWQDIAVGVLTDGGERAATKFYVNGLEQVAEIRTSRGYGISGTAKHRIKVLDEHGDWVWRHFADVRPGDGVPLALGQLIGDPNQVDLPPLSEKMVWAGEHHVTVPTAISPELAEMVGYFMGDGSLHARGLRLCVANGDLDVVDRLEILAKELFGIQSHRQAQPGYVSVELHSVRLAEWWQACGFAKRRPHRLHVGKGYVPHIPDAVLHSNDPAVYGAFLRGLFEADGTVTAGHPSWTTSRPEFADEVQTLLLALGFVTTRSTHVSGRGSPLSVLRLLNRACNARFLDEVGFMSARKFRTVGMSDLAQAARHDRIPVSRALIDRVAPVNDHHRKAALVEHARTGAISRRLATALQQRSADAELGHLLRFFYDTVATAELGDEELTYDLSVPANVTYVANGFVSHNTIGLMMDCDTTGVEPDLGLVKMKKLVGGGTMSIVNRTVPRALTKLGYGGSEAAEIVSYVDANHSIVGAPHLAPEHLAVFACSMGDNTIHYEGHVRMMGAVQPFLSGAISKTINMPEEVTVEDVAALHELSWRLGIKSVAIYRDNCKVGQPLSASKKESRSETPEVAVTEIVEKVVERVVHRPVRQKLPRSRRGRTFEFRVADCKGFATIGEYDDGQPGEIFLTVSKQGSTMSGIMDAFAKSISYGLQYGVPLRAFVEAFTNMRFEPAGMTDDPDIRFATSVMDYLFRRLALEYLSYDERAELGIFSVDERQQPTLPGVEEAAVETLTGSEMAPDPKSVPSAGELAEQMQHGTLPATPEDNTAARGVVRPTGAASVVPEPTVASARTSDAPMCMQCGVQMIRAGSCHACPSCGSTSGCS